jgi:hypothetical protein
MTRALNLQGSLDLGAGDFVAHTHQSGSRNKPYQHKIWLANNEGQSWKQFGYSLEDAIVYADEWSKQDITDCYVSANGFKWKDDGEWSKRSVSDVTDIQSFYVDFDYYKLDEYKDLSVADFSRLVLDEVEWLPEPTMIVSSGNGCWFIWGFKRPLQVNRKSEKYQWLTAWQTQQDFLVKSLAKFGADPACSDSSRVLRLPGTTNSKTNRLAEAWQTGTRYEFNELKRINNEQFRKEEPAQQLTPERGKGKYTGKGQKVSSLFNWRSLAYNRRNDLRTLAKIRGGKLTEHRRMAAFYYAVVSAHFCKTEDSLRDDVTRYVRDCFQDPDSYVKQVNYEEVVRRFNNHMALNNQGIGNRQIERKRLLDDKDSRYLLNTQTIVETLQITPTEQKQLLTLIGKGEKDARRTRKRREAGEIPRAEYLKAAQERHRAIIELRTDGLSIRSIAERIGCSMGLVHRAIST